MVDISILKLMPKFEAITEDMKRLADLNGYEIPSGSAKVNTESGVMNFTFKPKPGITKYDIEKFYSVWKWSKQVAYKQGYVANGKLSKIDYGFKDNGIFTIVMEPGAEVN
jgi:hypothetical protein